MANRSPITTAFLTIAALGMVALSGTDAAAQPREKVFVDLGRWTIYERVGERSCVLRLAPENGVSLAFEKVGSNPGVLTLQSQGRSRGSSGDVLWAFDEDQFPGRMIGNRAYGTAYNGSAIESAFRQAEYLTLLQGGATIARINLRTSSAGFRLLQQCADEWRWNFGSLRAARTADTPGSEPARSTAPVSAPSSRPAPPPRSQPVQAASRARDPVPRNPSDWIRSDTYSRLPTRTWGGGVLQFTLTVSDRGRAQECIVDRSSGSRDFDSMSCRELLQRARFDPALDDGGDPTEGRYSSSIRYELPE